MKLGESLSQCSLPRARKKKRTAVSIAANQATGQENVPRAEEALCVTIAEILAILPKIATAQRGEIVTGIVTGILTAMVAGTGITDGMVVVVRLTVGHLRDFGPVLHAVAVHRRDIVPGPPEVMGGLDRPLEADPLHEAMDEGTLPREVTVVHEDILLPERDTGRHREDMEGVLPLEEITEIVVMLTDRITDRSQMM